jgi:hypothetical protein
MERIVVTLTPGIRKAMEVFGMSEEEYKRAYLRSLPPREIYSTTTDVPLTYPVEIILVDVS